MSCEQCTEGFVMKGEPTGEMVDGAYFHQGSNKSKTVVLLTDIFGLPLVNSKLLADEFSKKLDCDVWVPDLFAGRPPFGVHELNPILQDSASATIPWWRYLRFTFTLVPRLHLLYASRASVVDTRVDTFINKIKAEKGYEKIGVVGYCFGGSANIRLGAKSLVDSVVICHPGGTTLAEIKAIKVPTLWVCAESDGMFGKKMRDEAEAIFAARNDKPDFIDYEFKDYKGTAHGFAVRPNLALEDVSKAYHEAHAHTIAWFEKTL